MVVSFFKKLYPYSEFGRSYIFSNFVIGCFIAFFLIVFEPFHISLWETDHKTIKLVGFGFVSFICSLIFKLTFDGLVKNPKREESWTIWKEILALLLVITFIAFGNLCYSNWISISRFEPKYFLFTFLATLLLGIFPIAASVAIKYNRFLTLNTQEAKVIEEQLQKHSRNQIQLEQEIISSPQKLVLIAENEKDKIELLLHQFLYIESTDNYSSVVFIENGKNKKELIRSSLKRLETQINQSSIVRCHRAYIVNLENVIHIVGNAQGYRISFNKSDVTIPVSRNYGKSILAQLKSIK